MPKVQVSDIDLYYEEYGEGFPLLMILGLQANIDWWGKSLLKKVSNSFRVIVFDNRGAGRSNSSKSDISLHILAKDAVDLMDALNIEQANVFGHSMGGMISLMIALNAPQRVKKLILCSSHCGQSRLVPFSSKVKKILDQPQEKLSQEEIAKNFLSIFYTDEFLKNHPTFVELAIQNMTKRQMSPKNYNEQLNAIATFDMCDKLKNIKKPTLVLHGFKDVLVPVKNGEILANLIPNAKLNLFRNSAHVPFVEERDRFIQILIKFLY